jgi:hypothetical protein
MKRTFDLLLFSLLRFVSTDEKKKMFSTYLKGEKRALLVILETRQSQVILFE